MYIKSFSAGDALGKTFSVWFKNIIPFTILAGIVFSPLVLYMLSAISGGESLETLEAIQQYDVVAGLVAMILSLVVTGAVTFGVVQQLRGQHASMGSCIAMGFKRLLPVLGTGIVLAFVFVGAGILLLIPAMIIPILGALFMVVALLFLYCMMYVAIPAAVVERPGLIGALSRSRELTAGYLWHVFGVIFVIGVIQFIVNYLIQQQLADADSFDSIKMWVIIDLCVTVVMSTLNAVASAVVYQGLREAKEGVGIEELADVFS